MKSMRITFDPEADAMYIYIAKERNVARTEEMDDSSTMIDFDSDGVPVGIEILNVSKRLPSYVLDEINNSCTMWGTPVEILK